MKVHENTTSPMHKRWNRTTKGTCMYDFLNSCRAIDSFELNTVKYFCFKFSQAILKEASSNNWDDTWPFSNKSSVWSGGFPASLKSVFSFLLNFCPFATFSLFISILCTLEAFSKLSAYCCPSIGNCFKQFVTIGRISARLWWRWIFNKGSSRKSSECSSTTTIASLYKDTAWQRFLSIIAIPASPFKAITNFLSASSPSVLVLPIRTYKKVPSINWNRTAKYFGKKLHHIIPQVTHHQYFIHG